MPHGPIHEMFELLPGGGERRPQHGLAGHDHDLESRCQVEVPEQLPHPAFREIPFHGAPDLLAGRDAHACALGAVCLAQQTLDCPRKPQQQGLALFGHGGEQRRTGLRQRPQQLAIAAHRKRPQQHVDALALPLFAMLFFLALFVGVVAWVLLARRGQDFDGLARLPLSGPEDHP